MASRLGVGILPSRLRSSETQATTPAAPGWRKRSSAAAATAGTEPRAATASSARGNERQGILRVAERDAVARRPAEFVQCPPRPDGPVDTRRQPPRDRIGAADRRRSRGPAGLAPARGCPRSPRRPRPRGREHLRRAAGRGIHRWAKRRGRSCGRSLGATRPRRFPRRPLRRPRSRRPRPAGRRGRGR